MQRRIVVARDANRASNFIVVLLDGKKENKFGPNGSVELHRGLETSLACLPACLPVCRSMAATGSFYMLGIIHFSEMCGWADEIDSSV
jgi:hypothetical protein